MSSRSFKLAADIGGTFTDVVLESATGAWSTKVLTTHAAPETAVLDGVRQVLDRSGADFGQISMLIHGTTLATNALIERRGARTALITTRGFRDVLEMRTENRFEQYDLNLVLPAPLIARRDRYVVDERLAASGEVLRALADDEIARVVEHIAAGGYESIAIGLIHAYANAAHEIAIREALLARLPDLTVSISSEVSPQMREYERFNTVCANAYVKPLMSSYLQRLRDSLHEAGADCPVFLMHSGGGIMSLESAAEFPVRLIESGPAGGAIFAAHVASRYGIERALSFDMGGTTAKICLIENHTPRSARTFEVARSYRFKKGSGMPISIPVIEMVEIGAGGGSIASVDALHQIRVGPESAGSEPGPACYQRGGEQPTITDADLLLGRLDPDNFAGGSITLSQRHASQAVHDRVGSALEMKTRAAAYGITEVVDENMANAARVHAVENGKDLGEFTMIAFGGAAPLHAARLCEKLAIDRFLVPPAAGVGSAVGFLRAPFGYEATRSVFMKLSRFDPDIATRVFDELTDEARGFVRSCYAGDELVIDRKLFMRYTGQGWEIPVELPAQASAVLDATGLGELFAAQYTAIFGRPVEGLDVDIASWSVRCSTRLDPVQQRALVGRKHALSTATTRELHDARDDVLLEARVVEREAVHSEHYIDGPAIVVEDETSVVVPRGFTVTGQPDGCLLVQAQRGPQA